MKKITNALLSLILTITLALSFPFTLISVAEDALVTNSIKQLNVSAPVTALQPTNGTGTSGDPYLLTSAAELLWFAETVNDMTAPNLDLCAKLMADIDLSTVCSPELGSWTPITCGGAYRGTFDGNGYEIQNLYINSTENYQGLFGSVDRATIKNLGVVDCNVTGVNNVGGIVGSTDYAIVENCFVTGSVSGNENVGGIYGSLGMAQVGNDISVAKVSGNTNVGVICGKFSGGTFSDSIGIKTENVPLFGATNNATTENVVEMADLSTGEACYFMNGNSTTVPTWYQNLGETGDECPVLDSTHGIVYKTDSGFASCNDHSNMTDGFCSVCGKFVSNGLTPYAEGVFKIDNAKKLLWFSYYVNYVNETANAKLISDIDLSTVCGENIGSWKPIADNSKNYTGTFDGNGHTINNLYINTTDMYAGLFGQTSSNEIKNINLVNADVTGGEYTGALCGFNNGTISHCFVSGKVTAVGDYYNVGGVCGYNGIGSTITDCGSNATVSVTGNNNKVGGVSGCNYSLNWGTPRVGTITGCYNTGSVTATGDSNKVGPVIGYDSDSTISVVTNNYYLDTAETDSFEGTTFKTEAQFKSGEVAYLLNNGVTDGTQMWYQTCHKGYPEISGKTVYAYTNCKNEPGYTNNPALAGTEGKHDYVNGICICCGENQPPVIFYEIGNAGQLLSFVNMVNGGKTDINAKISANIDMSGLTWTTISSYSGIFDGNGFTISNTNNLFMASLLNGGTIKNLTISGETFFPSSGDCGGIVGINSGVIEKSIVKNSYIQYSGWAGFGGVVGNNTSTGIIRNCAVIGGTMMLRFAASNATGGNSMGGICGTNAGTVENDFIYNTVLCNGQIRSAIVYQAETGHEAINCYYYIPYNENSAQYGIENLKGGTALTTTEFQSGKAAYLLQSAQTVDETGEIPLVWGQKSINKTDSFPEFVSSENYRVIPVKNSQNVITNYTILHFGDTDLNNTVDENDLNSVLQTTVGFSGVDLTNAEKVNASDLNGDGVIDGFDAALLDRLIAGNFKQTVS